MQHQENLTPDLPDAACKGLDVQDFYLTDEKGTPDPVILAMTRKVCARCPEQAKCLAYAMESEQFGMWGGLTEHERYAFGGRKTKLPKGSFVRVRLTALHGWAQAGGDVKALKTQLRRWFK